MHAQTIQPASCAATTHEAIAAAEKALANHNSDAALQCLVEALKQLEIEQPVAKRGEDRHSMLHAPELPGSAGLSDRPVTVKP